MRLFRLALAFLLVPIASLSARAATNAADVDHLHVQMLVPSQTLHRGETAKAGLYFKLESGWHVYWKNAGDSGEPPHVKWTLPHGVEAGPLKFPAPQRLPLGPLMDFGYENEVLFPFELNVAPNAKSGEIKLNAKVDWLVCREVCIPGKAELEVERPIADRGATSSEVEPDAGLYARRSDRLPKPLPSEAKVDFQPTPTGFRLIAQTGQSETQASFFPADQDVLDNPAPQRFTHTAGGFTLDLKKDANLSANPARLVGVLELSNGRAYEIAANVDASPNASGGLAAGMGTGGSSVPASASLGSTAGGPGLARIVALAFLGGLILNLMPCVFPVLFLKGLALVQSGAEEQHKLRAHGLVYTAGIVVSFWTLVAVLLGLRAAGNQLGWGFQFQSPVFLSLIAGLLFFLGLSLAGQFEIGLSLTSAGGSLAAKQGYTGSFFTGVLAVIVATPCTAPFMGAAIGYALAQSPVVTFAVFTALALGLAAPYLALTLQPGWTQFLPRPGAWMEVLRQAVAVPIFATVIWLAWVLAQAYGATALAALLASFLLLAIAGWFLGRWPAKRWSTGVAAVIAIGVIVLSIFSANALVPASQSSASVERHGAWEPWSADAVAHYQQQGRPVFVDFTASWCLSCQVNERVALQRPEVQRAFADASVALLRADWTQHDEAIGQTLTALGRSGVPAYALYIPGEKSPRLLPEVLTTGIVTEALSGLPRSATRVIAAAAGSR